MVVRYRGEIEEITIEKMPQSPEEFIVLRDDIAVSPAGGVVVFVMALLKYVEESHIGEQYLTVAVDSEMLIQNIDGLKGRSLMPRYLRTIQERIAGKPYIARSYVTATSPANGYSFEFPATFRILEQDGDRAANELSKAENAPVKMFVYSSGADSPRPIQVRQNRRGHWKAYSWSSLETGVRPPVEINDDEI